MVLVTPDVENLLAEAEECATNRGAHSRMAARALLLELAAAVCAAETRADEGWALADRLAVALGSQLEECGPSAHDMAEADSAMEAYDTVRGTFLGLPIEPGAADTGEDGER